jgi:hypothetical protein
VRRFQGFEIAVRLLDLALDVLEMTFQYDCRHCVVIHLSILIREFYFLLRLIA